MNSLGIDLEGPRKPSQFVQVLMLLIYIWEVSIQILAGTQTILTDDFRGFSQSLHEYVGIVLATRNRPLTLPFI
jgi:hypothetical protein